MEKGASHRAGGGMWVHPVLTHIYCFLVEESLEMPVIAGFDRTFYK